MQTELKHLHHISYDTSPVDSITLELAAESSDKSHHSPSIGALL